MSFFFDCSSHRIKRTFAQIALGKCGSEKKGMDARSLVTAAESAVAGSSVGRDPGAYRARARIWMKKIGVAASRAAGVAGARGVSHGRARRAHASRTVSRNSASDCELSAAADCRRKRVRGGGLESRCGARHEAEDGDENGQYRTHLPDKLHIVLFLLSP